MKTTYDVIIAGGGPVGLFLACELGMAGISVLVLERDESNRSPWKSAPLGLRGLNTSSVEAFYRRGLVNEIFDPNDERPERFEKTDSFQFGGHFAGMMLDANKLDLSRWPYVLQGPSLIGGPTDLERIGVALSKRAFDLGVTIHYGMTLTNANQSETGVTVETVNQSFSGKWLVGCDGGRSVVKKVAGFEFVGSDPKFTGYVALCDLDDSTKIAPGFHRTGRGLTITAGPGQIYVMDFDGASYDRSQSLTREHFQKVLRRVSGTDVEVKVLHLGSTFTDRSMQATCYRKGRILLAGDAAHIHSPLGAQGLNTGIGDAINLGWKLATTVKGAAPEGLLDSYNSERHPVAAAVLEWTRVQVTTLIPDLFGEATGNLMQDLISTVDGTNYFISRIWGIANRYELGSEHPLVGKSAPDFEFVDGERLGRKMEAGRGLIIDFNDSNDLSSLAAEWCHTVDYLNIPVKDDLKLRALIIRPDGVVAWATNDSSNLQTAQEALNRWFSH